MKLTLILLMLTLQVSATAFSQQISLNYTKASLQDVLQSIRKQSGYNFVASAKELSKANPVTINLKSTSIDEILRTIFSTQPFVYQLEDNIIMISLKKAEKKSEANIGQKMSGPISGVVLDSMGTPLPGASVSLMGQISKRTSTDERGRFTLKDIPTQGMITVSLLGYEGATVPYSQSNLLVTLKQTTSKLDEVRVIAYGLTSKRLSTSGTTGINADDIKTQPINNPLLALAGRTTGVVVEQANGLPGSSVRIRIQGRNSIGKGNDPFYVIDGVPYSANLLPTISTVLGGGDDNGTGVTPGSGNPFSFINPADIETIEILKDADATAIYGSRAANGAILITTKRGKPGKTSLDINFQQGIGKVARKLDLLNTTQYLEMRKEAYTNDGQEVPSLITPVDQKNGTNYDLTVWDQNRYTDWQKVFLGGSSKYTDLQTSISGGSNQTTFRLNGGYHRETTIFPGDFADIKASVGISVNHTSANQKFRMQFSGNYLNDNNKLPHQDITSQVINLSPNAPTLYKPDGSLNWEPIEVNSDTHDSVSTFDNPMTFTLKHVNYKTNNLIANTNLSYSLFKGLVARVNLGYSLLNSDEIFTQPLTTIKPEEKSFTDRAARYGRSEIKNWIVEPQLNYNTALGIGDLQALVGTTFQETTSDNIQLVGTGYPNDLVLTDMRAAATLAVSGAHLLSDYKYAAVFGRLNYNIEDKYIVNLTARRDGSSRFGSANQFHTFWATGAAWLFSKEDFVHDHLLFLSLGKLRGSYGTTGNDQIGNYSFLNIYNIVAGGVSYNGYNGLTPNSHYNPYLQWELTKKLQLGLDLGFIDDRLLLSLNYYRNQSSNQLLSYALPSISGFSEVLRNFPATVRNTGWEFSLTTNNIKSKSISWTSSLNLTIARNKLVKFDNIKTSPYNERLVIGQPINLVQIFDYAGIDPETGNVQFRAADGKITNEPDFEKDRIPVDVNPKYYGGLLNTINYKGFDLTFLFQFTKQIGNNAKLGILAGSGRNVNSSTDVLRRWQKPGDHTDIPRYSNDIYQDAAGLSTYTFSDASYIRLKNMSVSWAVPAKWSGGAKIQNLRVFAQAQNLWTITNNKTFDPETLSITTLPPLRTITFGAQITL